MKLRFGDVTLDGGRRLLHRGPEAVHRSPKAFQLIELLVARRPDAVSKAEIQEVLRPRTVVSETNPPALVNEMRQARDDDAKQPRSSGSRSRPAATRPSSVGTPAAS